MREIRFRGKRVDSDKWVYGHYIRYEHMGVMRHIIVTDWSQVYVHSHDVDPATVGQFTGLKDKNGKEIYEGDVLVSIYSSQKVVVEFREGAFYARQVLVSHNHSSTIEVIGNILDQKAKEAAEKHG